MPASQKQLFLQMENVKLYTLLRLLVPSDCALKSYIISWFCLWCRAAGVGLELAAGNG